MHYFLVVLFILIVFVGSSQNEEFFSYPKMEDFIKNLGYPIESHTLQTKTGYILNLFRIPHGKNTKKIGPPIILMHGLFGSSENYITLSEKSLSILTADAGYDVWLPNVRGNMHSRKHKSLDPDRDSMFWNFSWHEIGVYDLPEIIDFVLDKTGYDKVGYVGHSQGGTIFFVMCSERPEYKEKVSVFIGLAPGAMYKHLKTPFLQDLVESSTEIYNDMITVNRREFFFNFNDLRFFLYALSKSNGMMIKQLVDYFAGKSEVTDWVM